MIGYFSSPTAIRRAVERQERKEAMKKIRKQRQRENSQHPTNGIMAPDLQSVAQICPHCNGLGEGSSDSFSDPVKCGYCEGSGKLHNT